MLRFPRRALALAASPIALALLAFAPNRAPAAPKKARQAATATPIKHLVVIFQENVSFDHYFATYPIAANPPGEPGFKAAAGTPSVNGLKANSFVKKPT